MKKFIIRILIFGILSILFVTSTNVIGDKSRVFEKDYEEKIVEILSKGKNATNISNYDERKFIEYFIENLKYKPDVAIIGSSRSFSIDSSLFPGKHFINLSASRAGIYDFLAFYQLLKVNKMLPIKLILSVDPWVFNERNIDARWMTLEKYYNQFFGKDYRSNFNWPKIKQAFSPSYFQESFFEIKNKLCRNDQPIPTSEIYNHSNTKLIDGSLIYRSEIRNVTSARIKQKSIKYLFGDNYGLSGYKNHSIELLNSFMCLLEDAKENKIEIILFLAPFNPFIYSELGRDFPMLQKTEDLINDLGIDYNISVIGSYNPSYHNLHYTDFYDGLHLKKHKIDSLFIKAYAKN